MFTVETIGRYHLHDVVHHLWDVSITPDRALAPKSDPKSDA